MRDVILVLMLVAAVPFAIKHTYGAVMLWTCVSIMNPHKLAYGFANDAPFALVAAVAAMLSLLVTKDKLKLPVQGPVVVLMLFLLWMCITTAASFYPEDSYFQLKKVLKIQLMTLVALAALQSRRQIELFVWINVISIGYYGLKCGLFTVLTGGNFRVWGPPGSFIEGNNELAVALIMCIPLMNYLRLVATRKWVRRGLALLMLLSAIAALGTQSRGALLAIVAMAGVLWLRSDKKFVMGLIVVLAGVTMVAFMPSSWDERMGTIQEYEQDSSAMGRINAWWLAVNIANHRPTGGGFETYTPETFAAYAPDPTDIHVAHSIYFSVLAEHGYIGLFLFLALWWQNLRIAKKLRKETRGSKEHEWIFHLSGMAQVALVGYAVGGAFLSLAYFDLPYNIMVVLVVVQRWLQNSRQGIVDTDSPRPAAELAAREPAEGVAAHSR